MDDTLACWLRLREPADAAARSLPLTRAIAGAVGARAPAHVVDLASGTGANLRFLAPHLPGSQRWLLVDNDPALLALVPSRTAAWAAARGAAVVEEADGRFVIRGGGLECHVETRQMNLDDVGRAAIFEGRHLVTASALLDLTSERWIQTLAARCRESGAAALFALTYDGGSSCAPPEPEDDRIRDLLNRHQLRNKGLGGPAAGPAGADAAVRAFTGAGYRVERAQTVWTLDESVPDLQRQLIDGWRDAAVETAPGESASIADWHRRRMAHLDARRSRILVSHADVAAWAG